MHKKFVRIHLGEMKADELPPSWLVNRLLGETRESGQLSFDGG